MIQKVYEQLVELREWRKEILDALTIYHTLPVDGRRSLSVLDSASEKAIMDCVMNCAVPVRLGFTHTKLSTISRQKAVALFNKGRDTEGLSRGIYKRFSDVPRGGLVNLTRASFMERSLEGSTWVLYEMSGPKWVAKYTKDVATARLAGEMVADK